MSGYDPLTFERLPVLMMSDAASSDELLDRIVGLVDSLCDDLLQQDGLAAEQVVGIRRAKARVPQAITAYQRWISQFGWSEEQTQNALFLLATMADNLLCLGALAMRDPHSAAIVESIISGGQRGGQESAATRQSKAADDAALIEAEAKKLRLAHPEWSQDKVATEIEALWKGEKPPGHTKIKGVVSELEKTGKLPRRQKTGKPPRQRAPKSVNEGGSTS